MNMHYDIPQDLTDVCFEITVQVPCTIWRLQTLYRLVRLCSEGSRYRGTRQTPPKPAAPPGTPDLLETSPFLCSGATCDSASASRFRPYSDYWQSLPLAAGLRFGTLTTQPVQLQAPATSTPQPTSTYDRPLRYISLQHTHCPTLCNTAPAFNCAASVASASSAILRHPTLYLPDTIKGYACRLSAKPNPTCTATLLLLRRPTWPTLLPRAL